ncbi:MAG: pyridoxal phosphate-dependent aminotransferase [Planctomycetota bacterium]|nr:pyridoxal phosphate-dependent aminotransferase [Planctomycetota bacterium]
MLAHRMLGLKDSPTLALTAKVNQLRREGVDIIGFGAGEPDFDTPQPIIDAAVKAMQDGRTRYTAATGIPELKDAIGKKLREDNGLEYSRSEIVASVGAKHAIYNALSALASVGREVLFTIPYWVSYPPMCRLMGATPVTVPVKEENDFVLTVRDLERAATPRTKVLILNTPNNPTGAVYSRKNLEDIAEFCVDNEIFIISDEIYEKLCYDGEHVSIASLDESVRDITVTVNGFSKAYCMTGWRVGYSAAPEYITQAIAKAQAHSTSCITAFVQHAAIAALELNPDILDGMRSAFIERRNMTIQRLNDIPGIHCRKPKGAFYAFANVKELLGRTFGGKRIDTSIELAEYLLSEAKVAVVPGEAFGEEGFIRLSYCNSPMELERGIKRIRDALA